MEFEPAPVPELSARDVHVWRIDIDHPPTGIDLLEILSPDERTRAARFVRPPDRQRYTVSHAGMRAVLAAYLGMRPEHVEFSVRPGGKPELAPAAGLSGLRFNLSHSDGLAMLAVARQREVGVDVERIRPFEDVDNLVHRYFARGERAQWELLSVDERLPAFFRCWTRKEAYLKARGIGLSTGLDQFEVSFAPDEPARLVWSADATDSACRWSFCDISPNAGYMAACVVKPELDRLAVFDWPNIG